MSSMATGGIFNPSTGGGVTPSSSDVLVNKTIDAATNTLLVNGQTALKVLASNYTNATTTLSDVTGLSFAVAANANYLVICELTFSVDTNSATPNWAFTGPASPTTVAVTSMQGSTVSTTVPNAVTAFGAATSNGALTTISTNFPGRVTLRLQNGANAGTVQLQAKANGVGTVTILAGSMALIHQA